MDIPKDSIKVGSLSVTCDRPLAPVGFLYFTINDNDAGRIVFNRKDFKDEGEFEFHFNQTELYLYDEDSPKMKSVKKKIREALCKHFEAVDKTFDLREA